MRRALHVLLVVASAAVLQGVQCRDLPRLAYPQGGLASRTSAFNTLSEGTALVGGSSTQDSNTKSGVSPVVANTNGEASANGTIDTLAFAKGDTAIDLACEFDVTAPALPANVTIHTVEKANFSVIGMSPFTTTWKQYPSSMSLDGSGTLDLTVATTVSCVQPSSPNEAHGTVPDSSAALTLNVPMDPNGQTSVFCTITTDLTCDAVTPGHSVGSARIVNPFAGDADVAQCLGNEDCGPGQACDSGVCSDIPGGSPCDYQDDCGKGRSCVAAPGGGAACYDGLPNDPCELADQCVSGVCSTGVCN